jgi:hypothetical protein
LTDQAFLQSVPRNSHAGLIGTPSVKVFISYRAQHGSKEPAHKSNQDKLLENAIKEKSAETSAHIPSCRIG